MTKSELQTLDLSKVTDATSLDQINNSMEGLYRLGKNSKVENALATKTEVSKDGKVWHFTLRKNAKWSNGDPVTAKDFVYHGVGLLIQRLPHNMLIFSQE